MADRGRKKSPRAPSLSLDEALDRAMKAYDKERLHSAPVEVFAQNIGYKSANNGSALQAIASMRYLGLVERPAEGRLAVTKQVEDFKFSPDADHRRSLLIGFLETPDLYKELLEKYRDGLPSEANLRFELIQKGFSPRTAESAGQAFKKSVEFAEYFMASGFQDEAVSNSESDVNPVSMADSEEPQQARTLPTVAPSLRPMIGDGEDLVDRIPVRLHGGRKAWLVIPDPFFSVDKDRLKAQIDLLLTQDDETD